MITNVVITIVYVKQEERKTSNDRRVASMGEYISIEPRAKNKGKVNWDRPG